MYIVIFSTVYGRLVTVGSNKFGQLGVSDYQAHPSPCLLKGELISKQVIAASCGDEFTVVATAGKNMIFLIRLGSLCVLQRWDVFIGDII